MCWQEHPMCRESMALISITSDFCLGARSLEIRLKLTIKYDFMAPCSLVSHGPQVCRWLRQFGRKLCHLSCSQWTGEVEIEDILSLFNGGLHEVIGGWGKYFIPSAFLAKILKNPWFRAYLRKLGTKVYFFGWFQGYSLVNWLESIYYVTGVACV